MAAAPRFRAADVAMVRMPALPAARALATRTHLRPDQDGYPDRLRDLLRSTLADPILREAVEVSGGSLTDTLRRLDEDRPVPLAKLRRAAFALTRYQLRMSGRPTPFGLFAGVALAGYADSAKVRLGDAHSKGVRPDSAWLAAVISRLQRRADILPSLRITANDLCFVRGDRLVQPYVRTDEAVPPTERGAARELSVRYTAPVRVAIGLARHPVSYPALRDGVRSAFPVAAVTVVDALLDQLVEREILLTDLRPPLTVADPLGHLLDRLEAAAPPELAVLRRIAERLADYAAQPVGAGIPAWRAAVHAMRSVHPTEKPPIQVDLRVDADLTLPRGVGEEAARAAAALWQLAPIRSTPPHLRRYHAEFVERYGTDRLVPLGELLDPERGLGAPAGYRVPASHRRVEDGSGADHEEAPDAALAALAQRALLSGDNEVVLDDALIAELAPAEADTATAPESMELCLQLFAESTDALDAGDFRLVLSPIAGAATVGAFFGRFAYLFEGGGYLSALAGDARPDDPTTRRPMRAQLLFQPLTARSGNVTQVPAVHPYTVGIGTFVDRADPGVLGLADLAVSADLHRMYLMSPAHGREVVAVSQHMLNVEFSTPNAVRLIREITASGYRACQAWQWGRAAVLPRLPRVRYGRTILSPATWQVGAVLRDRNLSGPVWQDAFDAWRDRWQVPDVVHTMVADHRIELDLTAPLHRELLRHELTRRTDLLLSEPPGPAAGLGWLGGYANELVIPIAISGAERPTPRAAAPAAVRRRYLPGGEWLFAKLYSTAQHHDELLTEHLGALISALPDGIDRWFFIRYADPDPHLRLRFHGEPGALHADLLPALHDWATARCDEGLASRLALDEYQPELERYGGPAAIEAAERVFAADSAAVLAQLQLRRAGRLDIPLELLAAANYVDLLGAFDPPDGAGWLLASVPPQEHRAAFRALRRDAVRLIDPAADWVGLAAEPGGAGVLTAWRQRAAAVRAYGVLTRKLAAAGELSVRIDTLVGAVLHMHHNRLVGIDRPAEERSYAIARGAIAAHRDRVRAGT